MKAFFLLLLALGFGMPLQSAERPNILLICVDDLKPLLACYGDTTAKTPNIDALAARSLQFNRAYCNQSVCSPSRNSLLTGFRPQTLGIYDLSTHFRDAKPEAVTLPQYFRENGYRIEGLGKIYHIGHGNHDDPASWSVPSYRPKSAPPYADPSHGVSSELKNKKEPWKSVRGVPTEAGEVEDDFYVDGQVAAEAVKRLAAAKERAEPFFLAVGFIRPHLPFVSPKRYWDLYDAETLPLSKNAEPPSGAPSYALHQSDELRKYRDMPPAPDPIDEATARRLIHGYYAATSYVDALVGRVLDALRENGFDDNTIILLWGDHGWHLGDHDLWGKQTDYENAARVPLLIALPKREGAVTSALVETVDLYPTLAALAGLPIPEGLDGKSFVALFADPNTPHRDHVIHVTPRSKKIGRAIRTERYRLVEWKTPGSTAETAEYELYDYQNDPEETKNIFSQNPEVARELQAMLTTHPEAKAQITGSAQPTTTAPKSETKAKPKRYTVEYYERRAAFFKDRDKDADQRLTLEEFLKGQSNPEDGKIRFQRLDIDKDGLLTPDEFIYFGDPKEEKAKIGK